MATELEQLVVKLSANTEILHRELKRAERRTDGAVRNMGRSIKRHDKQCAAFATTLKTCVLPAIAATMVTKVG